MNPLDIILAIIPTLIWIIKRQNRQHGSAATYTQREIALNQLGFAEEMVWRNGQMDHPALFKMGMLLWGAKNTDDLTVVLERMNTFDAIWNEGVGEEKRGVGTI